MKMNAEQVRIWAHNWHVANLEIQRLRISEIRNANTPQSIRNFDLAFKSSLKLGNSKKTSEISGFHELLAKIGVR